MKAEFRHREPHFINEETFSYYAVVVPFIKKGGKWFLLYEKRAKHLKRGAGEICFPGGGIEVNEQPFSAALRELEEELHISGENFELWGQGDTLLHHSHHLIYSFLGELKEVPKSWSKDEVEEIILVPIEEIQEPSRMASVSIRTMAKEDFPFHLIPKGKDYSWLKHQIPMPFYETSQCVIWGMTARITQSVLKLIKEYNLLDE